MLAQEWEKSVMLGHLELVLVALQILLLLPHIGSGDNIGLASGLEMMLEIPGLIGRFEKPSLKKKTVFYEKIS